MVERPLEPCQSRNNPVFLPKALEDTALPRAPALLTALSPPLSSPLHLVYELHAPWRRWRPKGSHPGVSLVPLGEFQARFHASFVSWESFCSPLPSDTPQPSSLRAAWNVPLSSGCVCSESRAAWSCLERPGVAWSSLERPGAPWSCQTQRISYPSHLKSIGSLELHFIDRDVITSRDSASLAS